MKNPPTIRRWLPAALFLLWSAGMCPGQAPAPTPNPALPAGTPLLSDDLQTYKAYGIGPETCALEIVPTEGQPFAKSLRLTTFKMPPHFYDYGLTSAVTAPVQKGDVLWVSFRARRISSRKESGEAEIEVAFLQKVDGKERRPLARTLSFGPEWTDYQIPFVVPDDAPLGQAHLGFRYGHGVQSLEIGGVRLLDYGRTVKLEDLPRTFIRYDGWAPDAPWRAAAAERIEKYRKGDLSVSVTDSGGKPVPAAQVKVRMKRHAFAWGTAIAEQRILDEQDPDNLRYRQTLETYFNKVVFENSLKWGHWIRPDTRGRVLAALSWLHEHGFAVRGHVLVWPSWSHLPTSMLALKDDPAALKRAVSEHIADEAGALRGQLDEWDVANETYNHHDLLDILGRGELADWFRQTRAIDPRPKLFYNDYIMFHEESAAQYFYDTVKSLKDNGAPIAAIGEQGHFASSPPGIPFVLARLDKFGSLGLPIQISELDIDTDDAGLQADFMRDFMTAAFSHPSVMGVMQWGFWEKAHWMPRAALWDKDWNLRPHGKVWVDLVTKTWWTNADGRTREDGSYATRGFFGDYEVTVTKGDKSRTVKFSLSPQKRACPVTLP